jgi:N-acetylglucosamine-6-sulfatase
MGVRKLPRPLVAVLLALAALTVPVLAGVSATAKAPPPPPVHHPNVLLIVTDDQRWDTLWSMPVVQRELVDRGVTFSDTFVSNPLCCPSRASILTGNYSHTTAVYRQKPPFGAFETFQDHSTLATWLHDAGYETGMFGKYLDAYQHAAITGYVPPGWDRWMAFVHSGYYDYGLTVDGRFETHVEDPSIDYSTSVLGAAAASFIGTAPSDRPLFVEFAPAAPHDPATPAPEHEQDFRDLPEWRPPSYDEADISDKPAYMQRLPRLSPEWMNWIDGLRRHQYQTLQSVDEQIGALLDALEETGRLDDTLIVFTSDNGLLWGEHRWMKKEVPYDEALRVPLVIRDDRLPTSVSTDDHLVLNVDLAPTIAELASVPHPETDGQSLVPLLRDPSAPWRSDFLIEHMEGANAVPSYCGVRTETQKFVRYQTGERELYDLADDPYELHNLANDPAHASDVQRLSARLDELCDPPPPGMDAGGSTPAAAAVVGFSGLVGIAGLWVTRRRVSSG